MEGYQSQADLRLLKLGRCDMVLRVDFIKMKISFKKEGRTIELKGMVEEAKLHMMVATKVHKNPKEAIFGFVGQLFSLTVSEESNKKKVNAEVTTLLKEFQSVSAEPKTLPPERKLDHKISLIPGSKQVNMDLIEALLLTKMK
jgi:hypothetical protein